MKPPTTPQDPSPTTGRTRGSKGRPGDGVSSSARTKKLRRLQAIGALLLVFTLAQYLNTGASPHAFDISGRVVRIADGDTVSILDARNTQHKVRLYGIDTPERNQPFGTAARKALAQLVDEKPVGVVVVTTDSYGREVGTLYQQGTNINLAMVASGYAWWYQHYAPHDRELAASEQQARAKKLGLWADPHPVPPWDWRRGRR